MNEKEKEMIGGNREATTEADEREGEEGCLPLILVFEAQITIPSASAQ